MLVSMLSKVGKVFGALAFLLKNPVPPIGGKLGIDAIELTAPRKRRHREKSD